VTSTDIADSVIDSFPFLPYVEAEVGAAITDYASLTGANRCRLKAGVACWTAALLAGHLHGKAAAGTFASTGGGFRLGEYEENGPGAVVAKVDYRQKALDLVQEAAKALAGISTRSFTRPQALALAGPTRSKSNVPSTAEAWLEKIQPRILDWFEENGEDDR
jgi:hypothetical protein